MRRGESPQSLTLHSAVTLAESGLSLALAHGQLLFSLPGHRRLSGGPVREEGVQRSYAGPAGLAGQCPLHPAPGSLACSVCQSRACQVWPATCFCMAYELRLVFAFSNDWKKNKRMIFVPHEKPVRLKFPSLNKALWEHDRSPSFMFCLGLVFCCSGGTVVVTDTIWPTKPRMFTVWPFPGRVF